MLTAVMETVITLYDWNEVDRLEDVDSHDTVMHNRKNAMRKYRY